MSAPTAAKAAPLRQVNGEHSEIGMAVKGGFFISDVQLERLWTGDLAKARKELRLTIADLRKPEIHRGPVLEFPAGVREGEERDEASILMLCQAADKEVNYAYGQIDEERVIAHIVAGTRRMGNICWVIDGPDGTPVACTMITMAQYWFSRAWHLQVIFDFVHPDHRRSGLAGKLIQAQCWTADEWSRNFGYRVYIFNQIISPIRTREKMRLYRRHTNELGACYVYPLPGTQGA